MDGQIYGVANDTAEKGSTVILAYFLYDALEQVVGGIKGHEVRGADCINLLSHSFPIGMAKASADYIAEYIVDYHIRRELLYDLLLL